MYYSINFHQIVFSGMMSHSMLVNFVHINCALFHTVVGFFAYIVHYITSLITGTLIYLVTLFSYFSTVRLFMVTLFPGLMMLSVCVLC